MNKIHKVIWNASYQCFQVVSELGKSHRATCSSGRACKLRITPVTGIKTPKKLLTVVVTMIIANASFAEPTGGQVSAGQATINQAGNTTNINQSSQNAAINWQSFDVKTHETVNFHQPNRQSVTLNRVLGNERSVINGAMNANGNVFIQNPNGTLIGNGAQINVGGLVATSQAISDDDFMSGNYQFSGQAGGSIENRGNITVPKGGVVALIAPVVKNQGSITAPQGKVLLASAEAFSITLPGDSFAYTLDKGTLQGLVDNGNAILAEGGHVVLTALGSDSVKKSVINHSGIIEANTLVNNKGKIELLGDLDNTHLKLSGGLFAEAPHSGDGGFIETSAASFDISDEAIVSTKSAHGETGEWLIDPKDFTVAASGGDITGQQVSIGLQSNNIILESTAGNAGGKGDVIINDGITWNQNTLTLTAQNDIHINKTLDASGTAGLALEYGQATADGGSADYYLQKDTPVQNRTAKVNLPSGYYLTTKKGNTGTKEDFYVLSDANMFHTKVETKENIAIGGDIDLSYTANLNDFSGYELPPSDIKVHGMGHTLSNLTIDKSDGVGVGLITSAVGEIRNVNLKDVDIKGRYNVGGLVAHAYSSDSYPIKIHDNTVTGKVTASANAGGVIGGIEGSGDVYVSNNYSNVKVAGNGAGGLIAQLGWGSIGNITIENNHANSTASGSYAVGGLIGSINGAILGSNKININIRQNSSTGFIEGLGHTGGLIGRFELRTENVGKSTVKIEGNYSDAFVSQNESTTPSASDLGGLVGRITARVDRSEVGILVKNNYASGAVGSNTTAVSGGLIGRIEGYSGASSLSDTNFGVTLANNYASGAVKGQSNADTGGLVGKLSTRGRMMTSTHFAGNLYDKQTTGQSSALGKDSLQTLGIDMGVGRTTAEMKQKATFSGWDFDNVWRISEGSDYPRLRALTEGTITITDLGIKANDLSKTYDGKTITTQADLEKLDGWNGNGVTANGLLNGDSLSDSNIFTGTLRFDGAGSTWQGARNAGTYAIVPTGLGSQKYEIKYGAGDLTIEKKDLAISGKKRFDRYDNFIVSLHQPDVIGVVEGDQLEISGEGRLSSPYVGSAKITDVDNIDISGKDASNYAINKDISQWIILKAPVYLDVSGEIPVEDKYYDGTDKAIVNYSIDSAAIHSNVQVSFDAKFAQSDVGKDIPVSLSNVKLITTGLGTDEDLKMLDNFYIPEQPYTDRLKNYLQEGASISPKQISVQGLVHNGSYWATSATLTPDSKIKTSYRLEDKLYNDDKLLGNTEAIKSDNNTYTITQGTLKSPSDNYIVDYDNGYVDIENNLDDAEKEFNFIKLSDPTKPIYRDSNFSVVGFGISSAGGVYGAYFDYGLASVSDGLYNLSSLFISQVASSADGWSPFSFNEIDLNNPDSLIQAVDKRVEELVSNDFRIRNIVSFNAGSRFAKTVADMKEYISYAENLLEISEGAHKTASDLVQMIKSNKDSAMRLDTKILEWLVTGDHKDINLLYKILEDTDPKLGKVIASFIANYAVDEKGIPQVDKIISLKDSIFTTVSLFEKAENEEAMNKLLHNTQNPRDIARAIIQRNIMYKLANSKQFTHQQLSSLNVYKISNGRLVK